MLLDQIENTNLVEQYERALSKVFDQQLDHMSKLEESFGASGAVRLGCQAWPLRPLFLDLDRLNFISSVLADQLQSCKQKLLSLTNNLDELSEISGLPASFLQKLNLPTTVQHEHFLSAARPDGFLFEDKFVISEHNLGSGLLPTMSYCEVLYQLLGTGPVANSLGWSGQEIARPFLAYLQLLPKSRECGIALFVHSLELAQLYGWEVDLLKQIFQEFGHRVKLVDESSIENLESCDVLIAVTTGETFLEHPEILETDSELKKSVSVEGRLHPLSCFCLGKGALPWAVEERLKSVVSPGGFKVELPDTKFPSTDNATDYRVNKDNYVLKRAWTGKDTAVGISTGGRAWNRILQEALDEASFIIQEYQALPVIELPVLLDRRIEKLRVRVEISPFLVSGRYAGSLVRYAPEREGIILSPSPPDLGLTVVCAS